ncbi:MAG: hypothetical protein M3076_07955 [Actinomycetota bacterium]|nr:hypothetical protein [Actinomycetota bacterium]
METTTTLESVRTAETRGGNTRYVVRDAEGNEYTTFREHIGERARQLQGTRVRITYHEEQRERFTNVYLDGVEPAPEAPAESTDTDPQEAAWRTAVDAAPWLVGEPGKEVGPDELYEKLKPFEERVAADIERAHEQRAEDDETG